MMTDQELIRLLKTAVPPTARHAPASDLWPVVEARVRARPKSSAVDIWIAIVTVLLLVLFPRAAWLIAYHM